MKYTKGKWRVNKKTEFLEKHGSKQTLILCNKKIVAEAFGDRLDEAEANARLISVAPILYEGCQVLIESLCDCCKRINPQHIECTSCPDIDKYKEAIEKVKDK